MNDEICDVCGSTDVRQFKCKLICRNCGSVLRTCSDLADLAVTIGSPRPPVE